jgi:hypothetical protein
MPSRFCWKMLCSLKFNKEEFCIDVTFEMRTVHYGNAFIQLKILTQDPVGFISKQKRRREDKIAERPREREQV